jgi:NAD(P)-dependent dehydrogenase (short-subunit alcohol dehydrogenase family)
MHVLKPRIVFVTGSSAGIGRACVDRLRRCGHIVYGGSRSFAHSFNDYDLWCDVTDSHSVGEAIAHILRKEGRIDVVVNCAGIGVAGPVELTPVETAKSQFETNFFGPLRVCQAVLPQMRKNRAGLIVNISSIGGLVALPYQGIYSASKFALEGLTEALRMEVSRFGVRVVLVEPGDFCTNFTKSRTRSQEAVDDDYTSQFERAIVAIENDEQNGWPPERVAQLIQRIMDEPAPRMRYRIAPFLEALVVIFRHLLPFSIYSRLILDHFEAADK